MRRRGMHRPARGLAPSILWLALFVLASGPAFAQSSVAEGGAGQSSEIRQESERGPVRVSLVVTPAEPVIGDVVELVLEATSEPDVEVLMPEFGEALGRFEIIDFAPSERLDEAGRAIARQVYRLQPTRSGPQSIPPLRIEFVDRRPGQAEAPEGEDAYEMLTERVAFLVIPILAEDAPLELEPPHGDLGPRRGPGLPLWSILLGGALALAAIGPFVWRAFVAARARARQRSAFEVARSTLDALLAEGLPDSAGMDAFFVRLSLIVRTYLEDRFGLRSPELTTQEFLTEMGRSPDLARSHQQFLREFLEQADLVKFAGHRPEEEAVRASISSVEIFLEDTRDQVQRSGLATRPEKGAPGA